MRFFIPNWKIVDNIEKHLDQIFAQKDVGYVFRKYNRQKKLK